jgi:L,D-transpeptidase catalytic domain
LKRRASPANDECAWIGGRNRTWQFVQYPGCPPRTPDARTDASCAHRPAEGELGAFALDLGDGYLIHGTPEESTVGKASTHGCLRMREAELAWVSVSVPVGARVVIR